MLLVFLWAACATVFFFLKILPFGKRSSNDSGYICLLAPTARRILGMRYIIRPAAQTPPSPCVYIMNHQSALDILSNAEIYPKNCIVIVKRALTQIPFFGWIVALGDNIFLERENKTKSLQQMGEARKKMLEKNLSVWIFPEGTRRKTGAIHPFKRGAFHLAIQAQTPIVPAVVSSYHNTLNFGRWNSGTVIVEVLPPIPTTGKTAAELDELIAECHAKMSAAFARITAEVNIQRERATA
jgi:1-acyl-sn-glycerol-3-phosphate acyltransferase